MTSIALLGVVSVPAAPPLLPTAAAPAMNPARYASFSFGPNFCQSRPASCAGACNDLAGIGPLPNTIPSPNVPNIITRL